MRKLLLILSLFISAISFGQTYQVNQKDSTIFTPSTRAGAIVYVKGTSHSDTLRITERDTTGWHPKYAGTLTYFDSTLFQWNGAFWNTTGGGSGSILQYLTFGLGLIGSPYNGSSPVTVILDTSFINQYIINPITGVDTITYIVDSISNTPPAGAVDGNKYLVGTSGSGGFSGHSNQIASLIGGVYNYTTPLDQQQLIVDNAVTYATYQYNGTYNTGFWKQTSVLVRVGGNKLGASLVFGTKDNRVISILINNHQIGSFTTDSTLLLKKFIGSDTTKHYAMWLPNGKLGRGTFTPLVLVNCPSCDSSYISGDTIYIKSGGGSETWEDALQLQGSTSFTTDNTVDFGGHSLSLINSSNIYEEAKDGDTYSFLTLQNSGDGILLGNVIDVAGRSSQVNIQDTIIGLSTNAGDGENSSDIFITPQLFQFVNKGSVGNPVNIQANVDSSNANPNNIAWFDADNFLHRGHVSSSGSGTLQDAIDASIAADGSVQGNVHGDDLNIDSIGTFNVESYNGDADGNITLTGDAGEIHNYNKISGSETRFHQALGDISNTENDISTTAIQDDSLQFTHGLTIFPKYLEIGGSIQNLNQVTSENRTKIFIPHLDTLLTTPEFVYVSDVDSVKKYPLSSIGGSQDLQSVTDIGSTTTNNITLDNSSLNVNGGTGYFRDGGLNVINTSTSQAIILLDGTMSMSNSDASAYSVISSHAAAIDKANYFPNANGTFAVSVNGNFADDAGNITVSGVGTTTNALTFNNSGSGDASGTTFNGSVTRILSYNSVGAYPIIGGSYLSATNGTGFIGFHPQVSAVATPADGFYMYDSAGITFLRNDGFRRILSFQGITANSKYNFPTSVTADTIVTRTADQTLTNKTWNSAIIGSTYGGSGINNAGTLTWGAGGTLGTAAYTNSTAYEVPLTFSTGLTRSTNTITVNTSQNIATLSNLTGNGFVTTSGGTGALSITTFGTGVNTWISTPSSANLLAAITDETGTGVAVFGTNPTLSGFTLADATNVVLNTTTGTKIGTGTTQKLGFYNVTPVVQQSGSVITGLNNLGLFTGATVSQSEISSFTAATSVGTPNSTSTANGADLASNVLTLHYADGTNPGLLSAVTQTLAGTKSFSSNVIINATANTFRTSNGGSNINSTPLLINISGSATVAGSLGVGFDNTTGLQNFVAANGSRLISRVQMGLTNLVNTAGSETADFIINTERSAGAVPSESFRLSAAGNMTVGTTNSIVGTATNNNATAGNIGEEVNSTISTYTNYTTTATYQNITSITLTAGDWDLSAFFTYSSNGATITAASNAIFVISTTTASAAGATEGQNINYVPQAALLGTSKFTDVVSPYRVSISGTTTYYLNTQATFTLGNPQYVGSIRARRMR